MPDLEQRYDVVVVGARVAGAATALQLARAGMKVLTIDRARHGADTVSTHALMRGALVQLRHWGLLPALEASGTPAVRRTTFHYGADVVPVEIEPRDGVEALYAPRRTVLDAMLADAAANAGAEVRYGMKLVDLVVDSGRVTGVVVEDVHGTPVRIGAGLVIGADGIRSTVAKLVEAPVLEQRARASGTAYGYWSGLELDGYHWHYVKGAGAGAIPTTGGDTCVFVATTAERFRDEVRLDLESAFHRRLAAIAPGLEAAIAGRAPAEPLRAFPGAPGHVRRAHGPGWALVGDAGFFRDPITAHGITDALRDASLLADACLRGGEAGLEGYAREREPWALEMLDVTDAIASFEWDLDSVRPLHRRLSRLMARESGWLSTAPRPGRPASPPGSRSARAAGRRRAARCARRPSPARRGARN